MLSGVGLGWIPALDAPSLIVNWMSLPTGAGQLAHAMTSPLHGLSSEPFIVVCRLLGSGVFLVLLAWQWWLARDGGPVAVRCAAIALLWAALLAPATLPWYFTWALVLAAALPWRREPLALVVVGSTWLVLATYPTGESAFDSWPYQVGMVAVALVAATALLRRDPLHVHHRTDPAPVVSA